MMMGNPRKNLDKAMGIFNKAAVLTERAIDIADKALETKSFELETAEEVFNQVLGRITAEKADLAYTRQKAVNFKKNIETLTEA